MKFDTAAIVYPYPFMGVVARGKMDILHKTVDTVVVDPGNVTAAEALLYWGVNSVAFGALKSRSATDVSEAAFKLHCGDVDRMRTKLTASIWEEWEKVGDAADEDGIAADIEVIERNHGEREIRRTNLQYALFLEGLKSDKPGTVRKASLYRSTLMAHKVSKHFVETGEAVGGGETDPEAVAKLAVETKSVSGKRVRHVASNQRDQVSVRHALLVQSMKNAGIELTDDDLERKFVEDGPNAVSAMMNDINTVIDRKRRKLSLDPDDTSVAVPCHNGSSPANMSQ
jgi:hypothetical protein